MEKREKEEEARRIELKRAQVKMLSKSKKNSTKEQEKARKTQVKKLLEYFGARVDSEVREGQDVDDSASCCSVCGVSEKFVQGLIDDACAKAQNQSFLRELLDKEGLWTVCCSDDSCSVGWCWTCRPNKTSLARLQARCKSQSPEGKAKNAARADLSEAATNVLQGALPKLEMPPLPAPPKNKKKGLKPAKGSSKWRNMSMAELLGNDEYLEYSCKVLKTSKPSAAQLESYKEIALLLDPLLKERLKEHIKSKVPTESMKRHEIWDYAEKNANIVLGWIILEGFVTEESVRKAEEERSASVLREYDDTDDFWTSKKVPLFKPGQKRDYDRVPKRLGSYFVWDEALDAWIRSGKADDIVGRVREHCNLVNRLIRKQHEGVTNIPEEESVWYSSRAKTW